MISQLTARRSAALNSRRASASLRFNINPAPELRASADSNQYSASISERSSSAVILNASLRQNNSAISTASSYESASSERAATRSISAVNRRLGADCQISIAQAIRKPSPPGHPARYNKDYDLPFHLPRPAQSYRLSVHAQLDRQVFPLLVPACSSAGVHALQIFPPPKKVRRVARELSGYHWLYWIRFAATDKSQVRQSRGGELV